MEQDKEENKDKNQDEKEYIIDDKIKKEKLFKKIWNCITKIEKYPDMVGEGTGRAFGYLLKIVAILAIVICTDIVYDMYKSVDSGVEYLKNSFPEFTYENEILDIQTENAIYFDKESTPLGKVIIDTKVETQEDIDLYMEYIKEDGNRGLLVLKDRLILKNSAVEGTIVYEYSDILSNVGVDSMSKQELVDYLTSTQVINLYLSVFLTIYIYTFLMYLTITLCNVIFLVAVGYLTTVLAKLRLKFAALFSMGIYALTLSIILNIIYIGINIFTTFEIEYFQVMYISVASIYIIAAIFLLKTEVIKRQAELIKIAKVQEEMKKELEDKKQEEQENERRKKRDKEKTKEKNKKENDKEKTDKEPNPEGMGA